MLKKLLIPVVCVCATLANAEPQRTALTTENKFPELGKVEVGYDFTNHEFDDGKVRVHEGVVRYGLVENLTARLHVPAVSADPDFGSKEQGIGDIQLGLDLRAYEDIFGYPYVIPHLDVSFSTGDEDKGLGTGENMFMFGVAIGTKTHDQYHWVLDVSYAANYDAKGGDEDDVFMVGLSWIWDVSERFSVSIEGLVQDFQDTDNEPYLIGGGFAYKWTPNFQTRFFMGGWQEQETGEDLAFNVNATYGF